MKRILFIILIVLFWFNGNAQTNTWTGGTAGNWSTNASWSLGHYPTTVEDVVINTTSNINVDVFVSLINDINSLHITGGVNVTLSCFAGGGGGTRTLQLASTSAVTPGLKIDGGNTLIMDATNSTGAGNWYLGLTGAVGVTGIIDGTLEFSGSGAGTGGARLDVYSGVSANASLVVSATGKILYLINSGNTASASGSYLTLQSGAIYEIQKNGGSFPDGNWNTGSYAKATSTVASTTGPAFLGTIYGNLEWNLPNQGVAAAINQNITFNNVNIIITGPTSVLRAKGGTGAVTFTITINGDLNVHSGAIFETSGNTTTTGAPGIIQVKGNIINNGIIRENSTVTGNQFQLVGTSNQNISGSGSWTGDDITFAMNNSAGATLLSPVTLSNKLALTSGKIKTTSTNVLSMSDNAPSPTGGSSTSFVEGPMKKGGHDDTFTFPIGVGSIYSPATYYSGSLTTTDTIRAEYVRGNPQSTYGNSYDPTNTPFTIDHISIVEYWKIQKMTGSTASHNLVLYFTQYSFCKVFNTTFVTGLHPSTGVWQSCGVGFASLQTGSVGSYVYGYIQTTGQNTDDSIYTLGTSDLFSANPLPISLITFDAAKLTNTKSTINWELGTVCSFAAKFEIQRAGANKSFTTIGTIGGSTTNKLYDYIDNDLKNGINYYRLRMIDEDGKITYSRTVAVMNGVNGLMLTSLIPTVITSNATLTVASSNQQKLDIVILDMQGRTMMKHNYTVAAGNTNIELALGRLAVGVYQLTGISADGKTNAIRFIRQ